MMDRRSFLGLRGSGGASCELSCETLYMRLVDASLSGTTSELLARLESELQGVRELKLSNSAWLARAELGTMLSPVLAAFRSRGGRIELQTP